jgi:hypothetical protein
MTGNPTGTYYRAIQTVIPGIQLTNTDYWLPFIPTQRTLVTISDTLAATDGIAVLVLGDATSIAVSETTESGNAVVLAGSVASLSQGQTVTFSGYSLGGVQTQTDYQILTINATANSITITQDGSTPVALIDDQAVRFNARGRLIRSYEWEKMLQKALGNDRIKVSYLQYVDCKEFQPDAILHINSPNGRLESTLRGKVAINLSVEKIDPCNTN